MNLNIKRKVIELLGMLIPITSLFADQIYVTETGSGYKNGSSWDNAFADIQLAIDTAAAYHKPIEVWIAKGVYKQGTPIKMKNMVSIYGGFAGTEQVKINA